jgi:hypothetical protein
MVPIHGIPRHHPPPLMLAALALRHTVDLDQRPLYGFESHLLRQAILIPNDFLAVSISSLHQAYNRMVAMTVGSRGANASGAFPFMVAMTIGSGGANASGAFPFDGRMPKRPSAGALETEIILASFPEPLGWRAKAMPWGGEMLQNQQRPQRCTLGPPNC